MVPAFLSEQKHIAVSFVVAYILSKVPPPSSTQCSLGSLRGQAAGGEMERASCFC